MKGCDCGRGGVTVKGVGDVRVRCRDGGWG